MMQKFNPAEAIKGARIVVVKVGSAVLTKQSSQGLTVDIDIIRNLCSQLADLHKLGLKIVLVSSGAVAAGRTALRKLMPKVDLTEELSGLSARQAAAAIGQARLMHLYEQAFSDYGLVSAQVLLTRDDLRNRQRFLNARNTFACLLNWGIVPIVNENDTVSVNELKFSDNDNLASLLLNVVEADIFINLTTIGGVLNKNPLRYKDAEIMPFISNISELNLDELCGGKTSVGTGGMYSKLLAAHRAAQLGVPTLILPGQKPGVISSVFTLKDEEHNIGTWVWPEKRNISRRKFWLAYQAEPVGSVCVDAGAAQALQHGGSSLLPVGISAVQGKFVGGDLVRIMHKDISLGVGLVNYDLATLNKIKGLKRHEVAAILGNAHYPEVIHRDNLVLDAAI